LPSSRLGPVPSDSPSRPKWEPDPGAHVIVLIEGLQEAGYTGRIPSWLIRECYPVYAARRELQELDIDVVLEALHQKLGPRGKGKWKIRAEFGGVDRRSIGYEIPEPKKSSKVVSIEQRQTS
jgi:hypothetical protein